MPQTMYANKIRLLECRMISREFCLGANKAFDCILPDTQSKGETEIVPTYLSEDNDPFVHVHVCIHCRGAFRREKFEDGAHTTGIYLCPECGIEGPLNIEIHAVDTLEKRSGKGD